MSSIKQIVGKALVLTTLLWFALSGFVMASTESASHSTPNNESHQVTGEQSTAVGGAVHESGQVAGHGGAHKKDSLSTDKLKDLGFRVMNFAVLLFLLIKFGAKPVGSALSNRKKLIQEEIEDLESKRTEAERSYREFKTKLAGMEDEIGTIVEKAIAQAEIEKVKIIESANQAADDIKRQAEMAIQNETVTVRRALINDIADQATAMAEEIIVRNLKPEDQNRIIEDYLSKVGAIQ